MNRILHWSKPQACRVQAGHVHAVSALSFQNPVRQGTGGLLPKQGAPAESRPPSASGRHEAWLYALWTVVLGLCLLKQLWPWLNGVDGWSALVHRMLEIL